MDNLGQDLRYAARMLGKNPGFAAIALFTLALGIGANTAIFSVVNAVLLRPLPFPDSHQIVFVWETDANRHILQGTASPAEFLDWRAQNHVFSQLSAWRTWFYTLTGGGEPEQVWGVHTSAEFFRLLRIKPVLGRDFLDEAEQPGHDRVVLLSYALWQRRYGGDPSLIGRTIEIDQAPYTVLGVLPAGFNLYGSSRDYDLWMPMPFAPEKLDRMDHSVIVFGRLRPGATVPQAQVDMETILHRLQAEYPEADKGVGMRVVRMQDELTHSSRSLLLIAMGAVALVLLIACANVANLQLARATTREKEIALRASLGAGCWRLVRQLLVESILLALVGGALGVALAFAGLAGLRAALPRAGSFGEIPRVASTHVDLWVLAFAFGVSLLTGILFGLVPALHASRTPLSETLKEGGRGASGGRRGMRLRSLLVVAEIGLSLVLLAGAGLLIRSFLGLASAKLGFDPDRVLTAQVWLPENRYADGAPLVAFYRQALDRVAALPGVRSAGAVNFLPLTAWGDYCDFDIEGRAAPPRGQEFTAQYRVADPGYLRSMDIPLLSGRGLSPADNELAPRVAVINETLARQYWQGGDPVGKHIRLQLPAARAPWRPKAFDDWITIVGVAGDVRDWSWGETQFGVIYLPFAQSPSRLMRIVLRARGDAASLAPALRRAVAAADPDQAITEVHTMQELLSATLGRERMDMALLAIFAGFATLLAAVGIYGVMSYTVAQRIHDFGIRMALGARPADVFRLVVREGAALALAGMALGIAASLAATRLLGSLLYGVGAADPLTFLAAAALFLGVALAACYVPARRATRVDPIVALRYE